MKNINEHEEQEIEKNNFTKDAQDKEDKEAPCEQEQEQQMQKCVQPKFNTWDALRIAICALTRLICFIIFVFIATYEVNKYNKNDDASIFSVKPFEGVDWEAFPAITFCVQSGDYPLLDGLYNKTEINIKLNITAKEYQDILLGGANNNTITNMTMKKVIEFDFERNTMSLNNYLKKFRVQDRNENEYVWEYKQNTEHPAFKYVINRPFEWNKNPNPVKNEVPLVPSYLDPQVKCFTHHPQLDLGIAIDSIDFYFYISKLASIEGGRMYIYVHHYGQLIRNMHYMYKIRHFSGISRKCSNNQLVLDLNYVRIVRNREDA
jgi:hypothetical protein